VTRVNDNATDAELAQRLVEWFDCDSQYTVALSGGVDSAVVAQAAALSSSKVVAATAESASVAQRELSDANVVVSSTSLPHFVIHTEEIQDSNYRRNDARRCYYCKSQLFSRLRERFPDSVIVTGTNADDLSDYRPGLQAAAEAQVRAPLAELGMGKQEVRRLARHWNLHLADKPASPCLASRIAHGVEVTPERLAMVEQAEELLRTIDGLEEFRVRLHEGELARLEVPLEFLAQLLVRETRERLSTELHRIGFRFVSIDLDGFRSGSLNPTLITLQAPVPSSVSK
jgi:pyridinium-3,5-biscarboxylic acid mononucleotide sulfurtransferase